MAKHPHDKTRPTSKRVLEAIAVFEATGDIEPLRLSLTVRQRHFAEEYVVDFCSAKAAIRAGYSTNCADRAGYVALNHKGVSTYIDYLSKSKEAKIIAVDPDYVLSRVTQIINRDGAKDGDKLRGLELLARHLGMLTDKTESHITVDMAEKQKVEEEAENFTNELARLRERASQKKQARLLD